jgi:hypothetical protein
MDVKDLDSVSTSALHRAVGASSSQTSDLARGSSRPNRTQSRYNDRNSAGNLGYQSPLFEPNMTPRNLLIVSAIRCFHLFAQFCGYTRLLSLLESQFPVNGRLFFASDPTSALRQSVGMTGTKPTASFQRFRPQRMLVTDQKLPFLARSASSRAISPRMRSLAPAGEQEKPNTNREIQA